MALSPNLKICTYKKICNFPPRHILSYFPQNSKTEENLIKFCSREVADRSKWKSVQSNNDNLNKVTDLGKMTKAYCVQNHVCYQRQWLALSQTEITRLARGTDDNQKQQAEYKSETEKACTGNREVKWDNDSQVVEHFLFWRKYIEDFGWRANSKQMKKSADQQWVTPLWENPAME